MPIQLVIATALMAIARKVIVLDIKTVSAEYVLAIAAVVLALGITHWLVTRKH
ncbi:phosphate-starvation-inducible PsiE family protein [Halomonas sp. I1]|uniref:phosphate-starvation-inducible PsiE family protein n=1 Tax=Halomonas sp. I1 TaxID=393536 RepID=UPI0028DF7D42|nr:phosphate-starvation-inducible PsiE family protein [Halomonas sp. I1]MDT8895696.1 phosphate-starvation-inducible PsiE family protein [Halomonas sp. I1]